MALRNYVDTEDVTTEGQTVTSLLASYRKRWVQEEETGQKPVEPMIFSIELIKGNNVSEVKF